MTRSSPRSLLRRRFVPALLVIGAAVAIGAVWIRSREPDTQALAAEAYDLIQKGEFDSARQVLIELHRYKPDDAEVVESLAELCINAGDEAAAIDWLQQVPDSSPQKSLDAAFRGAQLAMQWHRAEGARQCLNRCLQLDPDHAAARRLLIHLELILTRWEAMFAQIAALDQQGQATPADVALLCIGRNYYWEDDSHLEWLEACVKTLPDDCLTRTALAYYYRLENRREEAASLLHNTDTPGTGLECWRVVLSDAEDSIEQGNFKGASAALSQLPAEADLSLRTWLAYARIFTEQGEFDSAIAAYENASRLSPVDPEPVSALSRLMTRQKRHGKASDWAKQAQLNSELWQILSHAKPLAPQGPPPETVMQMGRGLQELGHHRAATICFESLTEHFEFGAEASRLAGISREAAGPQSTLDVAGLQDLNRSVSLATDSHGADGASGAAALNSTADQPVIALHDIAAEIGLDFTFFRGDAEQDSLEETLGGGIGVIDFDMDDWPDIFLTQGTSLPVTLPGSHSNRLFRNVHATAAVDVTDNAGVPDAGYGQGCAVADINNDGFPDLYVCNNGSNILYQNNGDGTFRNVTSESGLHGQQWSTSASFADFDRDGDPDLYSANYVRIPEGSLKKCRTGNYYGPCRVMDYPAEQDVLWINDGHGSFQDFSEGAGIVQPNGKGLGVVSADFDNDGWVDLFVGNDTTGNYLFQNLGTGSNAGSDTPWRGFSEVAVLVGVAFNRDGKGEACMGIACEDLDHDGLFDIFITNYELETNTFYANLGSLGFEDRTHRVGLAAASRPMLGWGVQFIDLDADRDRDLFVTNGHLYEPPMRSQVFLNRASEFIEVSDRAGSFFESERFGRSSALVDWDRDLAADLVVSHLKSRVGLLTNRTPAGNRLTIRLIGVESTRQVQGAQVSVTAGGGVTHFSGSTDGGYFAANENDVKIGLGPHEIVETLEVKWPSGNVQQWHQLPAGKKFALIEGRDNPWDLESVDNESSF